MFKQMICQTLPTEMCHGASFIALPDGRKGCAWFGGSHEGAADTEIYFSEAPKARKNVNKGRPVWTEPVKLTDFSEACWNPVLFYYKDELLLYFRVGNKIADWQTYVMKGVGNPVSWTAPRLLAEGDESGGRGPVKAKPLVLNTGRIIAGNSVERGEWHAFCDYSDDGGVNWKRSNALGISFLEANIIGDEMELSQAVDESELPPLTSQSLQGRGIIQPVIWQELNGKLHMYMRSTEEKLYSSSSVDGGASWEQPQPTELLNNNSAIDLIRTPGGRLFMAANPVGKNWGARTPLTLFMGKEDGSSWERVLRLEKGKGEFSYPSLSFDHTGLWCAYTYKRENIAVQYFSWKDIAEYRTFRRD